MYISHTPFTEASALKIANILYRDRLAAAHEACQQRMAMHRAIATHAENGQVALVYSGMDCDCVRYDNEVSLVSADWKAVVAHTEKYGESADGPWNVKIVSPSYAAQLERTSEDLAMQAHEDGHPHFVYG